MEQNAAEKIAIDTAAEDEKSGAEALLPHVARQRAARTFPTRAGFSFFYELGGGWETRILQDDPEVCKARTARDLEDAFTDGRVKIIFIPKTAAVTKNVALRVCRRHGAGKTVFYEGKDNE